jgi:hypothetical protein
VWEVGGAVRGFCGLLAIIAGSRRADECRFGRFSPPNLKLIVAVQSHGGKCRCMTIRVVYADSAGLVAVIAGSSSVARWTERSSALTAVAGGSAGVAMPADRPACWFDSGGAQQGAALAGGIVSG